MGTYREAAALLRDSRFALLLLARVVSMTALSSVPVAGGRGAVRRPVGDPHVP